MKTKQEMPAPLHAECNHDPKATHEPTPWKIQPDGNIWSTNILVLRSNGPEDDEDFAYIVQAVNAHEELLAVVNEVFKWAPAIPRHIVVLASQAIAKSGGEIKKPLRGR